MQRKEKILKKEQGITLVALIITIIVLMILAVVTIQTINGDGIISHASNARDKWRTEEVVEESRLASYQEKIESHIGDGSSALTIETIAETPDNKAVRCGNLVYVATGENTATVYGDRGDIDYTNTMGLYMTAPTISGDIEILPQITINEEVYNVTTISGASFASMMSGSQITSLKIPNSITEFSIPLQPISTLSQIIVANDNLNYVSEDGVLFNKEKTTLLLYPAGKTATEYTIPNTVTIIYANVPTLNHYLETLNIPASLENFNTTYLGGNNFMNINVDANNTHFASDNGILFNKTKTELIKCPNGKTLSSYTIPDSTTTIKNYAFYDCTKITELVIPNQVTSVEHHPFGHWTSDQSIRVWWQEGNKPEGWYADWDGDMINPCNATIVYAE